MEVSSFLIILRFHDVLLGTFDILQNFIKNGVERKNIVDIFSKLSYHQF